MFVLVLSLMLSNGFWSQQAFGDFNTLEDCKIVANALIKNNIQIGNKVKEVECIKKYEAV